MAFLENITTVLGTGAKSVADKTKELSETASYRANMASIDSAITNFYKDLGRAYFEDHPDKVMIEYPDLYKEIDRATKTRDKLVERIAFAKGEMICGKCGASIAKNSAYCNACGAKVEEVAVLAKDAKVADKVDYYEPVREKGASVEEGIKEAKEFFHDIKDQKPKKESNDFFDVIKEEVEEEIKEEEKNK